MILFIHETKHVGGGQSFVQAYKELLTSLHVEFEFFENKIDRKLIKDIILQKYHKAFLHLYSPKYLPLIFLLKLMKIPIVLTVYGVWYLESKSQNPFQSRKEILFLRLGQGLIFWFCDTLIVFSHYEKKLVQQHFQLIKKKVVIVPGGVDKNIFFPVSVSEKNKIRKKLHLSLKSRIFLVLSRLEKRKGIDIAIRAFNELLKTNPNSFLLIIFPTGEYTYFEVISECFAQTSSLNIGKNIHFVTGVNNKWIPLYFQSCDFFLMSSTQLETFGLTTIEAAASGCIPIGFQSGATPELLSRINNDLIVSPINSEELAQKMNWLLSLPNTKRLQLQRESIEMSNSFSWGKISKTLHEILL